MDELEAMLGKAMQRDFSAGTEAFRDALLARCLVELDTSRAVDLDDGDLETLAAAGAVPNASGFGERELR